MNNNISLRLLFAEDSFINQKVVMAVLQKMGWTVTLVENGLDLLREYAPGKYDAILTDVQMPGMDGYEITSRIREMEEKAGGHVPIIAMTGIASIMEKYKCIECGMDALVSKPIQGEELVKAVLSLVGQQNSEGARV